jgi:hypothetical protein
MKRLLASVILPVTASAALAQSAVMEREPNDTPAEANAVAGNVLLMGAMQQGDQDGFMWTVSDEDARQRWTFKLDGIPGRLTVVDVLRLEYTEDGKSVAGVTRLLKLGSRDGIRPAIAEDLLFEPGDYLLGLVSAGGGASAAPFRPPAASLSFGEAAPASDAPATPAEPAPGAWRLSITAADPLRVAGAAEPHASVEEARAVRLGLEYAELTAAPSSWYAFEFKEEDAQRRWDISAQIPVGRDAQATLFGAAGDVLARARSNDAGTLTFPDLAPSPGTWRLELQTQGSAGFLQAVSAAAVGARAEGEEAEPNDQWRLANRARLGESEPALLGRMGKKGEADFFSFSVDDDSADSLMDLRLETGAEAEFELCLLDARGKRVQCRREVGGVDLPDLLLTPGEWGLSIARGPAGAEYTVQLLPQGTVDRAAEAEPNDAVKLASSVPANNRIKGRFSGKDTDYYRFVTAEEPQLWRFQVIGDGVREVAFHDGSGAESQRVRPRASQRRVRLDNVYLLPGTHYVSVAGDEGGEYTLLARPLGPPDPDGEREPNDDSRHMQPLEMGQTRNGYLQEPTDEDFYRFFLGNWDRIRLTAKSPVDGAVAAKLYWYGDLVKQAPAPATGEASVLEGLFPPGDYYIVLSARETSDAEYALSLERLSRFGCPVDCEPNDNPAFANPLPRDLVVEGTVGDWRDIDVYALPVREQATEWTARVATRRNVRIGRQPSESVLTYDSQQGLYRGTVPAGEAYYLFIEPGQKEAYRVELDFSGRETPTVISELPLSIDLRLDTDEVAAYLQDHQRLDGELLLENRSPTALEVGLDAATSDYRWSVAFQRSRAQVPANGRTSIPVTVEVPADTWADVPVRISVRASRRDGAQVETFREVTPGRETLAAHPRAGWSLPEPLLGGVNTAWSALGARLVGDYGSAFGLGIENVFNGINSGGHALETRGDGKQRAITIELAGGEPVDVVGSVINLATGPSAKHDLRVVDMSLSEDGQTFTRVLHENLMPVKTDQALVLEKPVKARYARLRLGQNYDGNANGVTRLAEWEVIAKPGTDLSKGKGFNIADPALGGHVVWARPVISARWDQSVLTEEAESRSVRLAEGEDLQFVVAFHHNRAAQVARLEWVRTASARKKPGAPGEVTVSVSMDSPVGPWTPLETWPLDGDGLNFALELEEPTWARFVRFTVPRPADSPNVFAPETIRVWERPTDEQYRSILTEWGYASRSAIYEALQSSNASAEEPRRSAGNDSPERAASLELGETVAGRVVLGKEEHWYRLEVPPGHNTLQLRLEGKPTVSTVVELESASRDRVPLRKLAKPSTPERQLFEAVVEPGGEYRLHVSEPPRNVIFAWDTSASVLPYLSTVYNALTAFADDVVRGREAVNLIPFGRGPLLQDWYGEPYVLKTVLNDYLRGESSSEAERTLYVASRALAPLPGTKAIVVITDAVTNRYAKVWDAFKSVQPRIFAIGVGGNLDPRPQQRRFEDWRDVNAGHYAHMAYDGEMEVAFDRAATLLRRPAEYRLTAQTESRPDPGPGTLTVVPADPSRASSSAVELILDASGSMLQRIEGKRRIEIAKDVLIDAVEGKIPPDTPTALRAFGHKEPNSCRTDLEIPMKPLDRTAVAETIRGIQARNLARTPIADSLAKVEQDVGRTDGAKVVILVTDGEETCGGNPEQVIASLREKGIGIAINIVGFAIDDDALEAEFSSWAELGGGRYFSAADQHGLSEAIAEALQLPFSVYDSAGNEAASGVVGAGPVELEPGVYRVVVASFPRRIFEDVEVTGGQPATVTLEGPL